MKRIHITGMVICLILSSFSNYLPAYSLGSNEELIIGKIEFISSNGLEGIIIISDFSKIYLLLNGTNLAAISGEKRIMVVITDVDGKYARCALSDKSGKNILRGGENVYYSDSNNAELKYFDAKRILGRLIKLNEEFILKIESTEDPEIISKTVSNYAFELELLFPEMTRINNKYPELVKSKISAIEELKKESELLDILKPRLNETFFKVYMFKKDENVKKAIEKLESALSKMMKPDSK